MNAITIHQPGDMETVEAQPFDELVDLALQTVSASSGRIYRQTFALWRAWCVDNDVNPLDWRPAHVVAFLDSQDTTKATRQRQLSAIRKLAGKAHDFALLTDPDRAPMFAALRNLLNDIRPPASTSGQERTKRALTWAEADKVLRTWAEPTNAHRRNRALIAVLALGALRRSEAAALTWSDVDFDNGVITVRHGKGDKTREVPLAGEFALDALRHWQLCQESGRRYVFCPMERGDHLGKDKPIRGTDIYEIVKQTEARSGIEFKPHDLRRTFITEALATGTPLATVQAAAGHARGETTLRYAQAVDARRARRELKLRYG